MRYVTVLAHPDDEMRCLGTLLRLRDAGHEVGFITVSAGDKGLPYHPPEERARAAEIRDAEMRSVAAAFDGEYICLGRPDGYVFEDADLRRDLIDALRRLRADVVFTHWTTDYNPDHVVTAKLTGDAALFANLASWETDAEPLAAVPRIWYVDPGAGHGFEATHFVALSPEHVNEKNDLIRLHRSQMEVMRRFSGTDYVDEMTLATRVAGRRLLVDHAEAFRPCLTERRIPWPSDLPGSVDLPGR